MIRGIDSIEGCVDFGLDRVEGVENSFGFVEVFACRGEVLEAEFDICGCNEGIDVGILG